MELEKRRRKAQMWNSLGRLGLMAGCASAFFFLPLSCKQPKKYHDQEQQPIEIIKAPTTNGFLENQDSLLLAVVTFQENLNETFRDPETSPLKDADKMAFSGLDFFPPNANFITMARLQRTPEALPFGMPTNTERMSQERLFGKLFFELQGRSFELNVYESQDLLEKEGYEDYLFLPFTDLSNGATTYGGGRYLDLRLPQGDQILLDFNRAYNPYCAYNKKYSCPIVPPENHLNISVEAGVKAFK